MKHHPAGTADCVFLVNQAMITLSEAAMVRMQKS
jgi:hypothetical protein